MMSNRVMMSGVLVLGVVLAATTAAASNGTGISWSFQATGHQTPLPVTALALRDGLTWPVIFASDSNVQGDAQLKAISLYPVYNHNMQSYWHEIGHDLLPVCTVFPMLHAASSPTGEFAATCWHDPTYGSAVTGSSTSGFSLVNSQVNGIDYDMEGNLVTLTPSTLPWGSQNVLYDIDSSIPGTIGAVARHENRIQYFHTSSFLDGWFVEELQIQASAPYVDLVLDTYGRPYITFIEGESLFVKSFDVISGTWTRSYIDNVLASYHTAATIAADNLGGVGMAWVSDDGVLKYAYKNGNSAWATHVVTSGLSYEDIPSEQTPGLAFDANDFPVISFVTNTNQIWMAYDPVIPEPSTALLLVSGLLVVGFSRRRRG